MSQKKYAYLLVCLPFEKSADFVDLNDYIGWIEKPNNRHGRWHSLNLDSSDEAIYFFVENKKFIDESVYRQNCGPGNCQDC